MSVCLCAGAFTALMGKENEEIDKAGRGVEIRNMSVLPRCENVQRQREKQQGHTQEGTARSASVG